MAIVPGMSVPLREELLERCEKLAPAQVREVLDFAEFLLTRPSSRRPAKQRRRRQSLQAFVGGVSQGTLAQNIDHDLYDGALR